MALRKANARRRDLLVALGGALRRPYHAPFPPSVRQEAFLRMPQLEVFFGGSAGPGKSTALLEAALMYADQPGYAALLLRRNYPQLSMPGGLIPMSLNWLADSDATWSAGHSQWRFPKGATLTFGHVQNEADIYRYLGQEYQYIGFDELTQFSEKMYRYLFSRLRRANEVRVPLRMRGASNPGGPGHDWVKRRFIDPETREPGSGYVRALMTDNPGLDVEAYLEGLAKLHPLIRRQLQEGDWDVASQGSMFQREAMMQALVPASYPEGDTAVRTWDLAATAPSDQDHDPDYTVGLRADWNAQTGIMVIRNVVRDQLQPDDVDRLMRLTATGDGPGIVQRVEEEGGSSGKMTTRHIQRNLQQFAVQAMRPTGSKEQRAVPFSAMVGNGLVRIVEADWTMGYIDELSQFPEGAHDDQVDTSSSAHEYLSESSPAVVFMADDTLRLDA